MTSRSDCRHALLPKLRDQLRDGLMDRRTFIRFATLLGVAAGAAYTMAGIAAPAMADDRGDGARKHGEMPRERPDG